MPPSLAHVEWGAEAVEHHGADHDVIVVVDVLSATTAIDVAVTAGASVRPVALSAAAAGPGEVATVGRFDVDADHPYSLSPPSLAAIPAGTQLVLASPNGAALSASAAATGARVLAGCLRNARAVAAAVRDASVLVVAAGERWGGKAGPLRPALEDVLGAGAIVAALGAHERSAEAEAAARLWVASRADVHELVAASASGRQLAGWGFLDDVRWATEHDVSTTVPTLVDGVYRAAA